VLLSPQGGEVPYDSGSVSEKWLRDGKLTATTTALADADPTDFDATLIIGGHGALVDLVDNTDLHRIVAEFAGEGKPIAAVDHGTAVLAAARPNGVAMMSGVIATGRSDDEERRSGHLGVLPRTTEQMLRDAHARSSFGPAWRPHVLVHGRLISGQNPSSTSLTVQSLLAASASASRLAA
jgi:putative intracellular protease/amidase